MSPPSSEKPSVRGGPPIAASPRAQGVLATAIPFGLCLLHAWIRLVPWSPAPVGADLDGSWRWFLGVAWKEALVFGRDVVFTYGPYGFLANDVYHPATFAIATWIFAVLAPLVATVVWRIVRAHAFSPWVSLGGSILVLEAMSVWEVRQNFFLHLAFVLLWFSWSLERRGDVPASRLDIGLLHGLTAALAPAALTKFTYALSGIVPVVAIAASDVARRRRFPRIVATYGTSLVAFWLLAGQPLSALGDYLSSSLEIVAGYGESMAGNGPLGNLLLFLGASLVLLWLHVRVWGLRRPGGSVAHLLGLAALLFLVFKAGFVRFDPPHAMLSTSELLLWVVAAGIACVATRPKRDAGAAAVAALALLFMLASSIEPKGPGSGLPTVFLDALRAWPGEVAAAGRAITGRTGFDARHESVLEEIRRTDPVPRLPGSVDVVPALGALALANGLDYRPRPVLQSYCAFTPGLLRRNAEYLSGPHAPESLLFTVRNWIDFRFPSMDDSLSWPILLSRYSIEGVAAKHLVLRRTGSPRAVSWKPLGSGRSAFGRAMSLQNPHRGTALWVEIDVHPTWLLRAANLLYRPPVLSLTLRTSSGEMQGYRLVPGIARAGFLLSPVIRTDEDFTTLATRGRAPLAANEVEVLSVGSPDGEDVAWAYGKEYEVRLSVLEIGS